MTPQEKLQMAVPAVAVSNANPSHQSTGLHSAETPSSIHFNARSQEITMSAVDAVLPAQDISIEKWQTPKSRTGNLGSLREEKSYEYNGGTTATAETEEQQKRHKAKQDTMFRLNTKRMSYKGFEFGDFGFMTTDFDQLSRGHTQFGITLRSLHIDSVITISRKSLLWISPCILCSDRWVNQVLHHPMQNGIVITARYCLYFC